MSENHFREVEFKYDGDKIDLIKFKSFVKNLKPTSFLYVESKDIYFSKSETEFLRYRMPPGNGDQRAELTFKKKSGVTNNVSRIEVNLRVDNNSEELVKAFCEGLQYVKNFEIIKFCHIYRWDSDGTTVVFYTVIDEAGEAKNFVEIESAEDRGYTEEEAMCTIIKYEKLLAPLGITAQKRNRLSLWERYRK